MRYLLVYKIHDTEFDGGFNDVHEEHVEVQVTGETVDAKRETVVGVPHTHPGTQVTDSRS